MRIRNSRPTRPWGANLLATASRQLATASTCFAGGFTATIFIVTDEGVIVTDPMNPKAAKLLQAEIRKVTDKPVKYVVYSHNHHDHISGGIIFKAEGATFVGHENVLKELGDHPSAVTPLPDITFSDRYELTLGDRTLVLEHYGPNHGESLVTLRLPREKYCSLSTSSHHGELRIG